MATCSLPSRLFQKPTSWKRAEARRQLGDRHHPDADPGGPEPLALVVLVPRRPARRSACRGASWSRPSGEEALRQHPPRSPGRLDPAAGREAIAAQPEPAAARQRRAAAGPASSAERVRAGVAPAVRRGWPTAAPAHGPSSRAASSSSACGQAGSSRWCARPGRVRLEHQGQPGRRRPLGRVVGDELEHPGALRVGDLPGRARRLVGVEGQERQAGLALREAGGARGPRRPPAVPRAGRPGAPAPARRRRASTTVPARSGSPRLRPHPHAGRRPAPAPTPRPPAAPRVPAPGAAGRRSRPRRRRAAARRRRRPPAGRAARCPLTAAGQPGSGVAGTAAERRQERRVPPVEEGRAVSRSAARRGGGWRSGRPRRGPAPAPPPGGRLGQRPGAGEPGDASAHDQDRRLRKVGHVGTLPRSRRTCAASRG